MSLRIETNVTTDIATLFKDIKTDNTEDFKKISQNLPTEFEISKIKNEATSKISGVTSAILTGTNFKQTTYKTHFTGFYTTYAGRELHAIAELERKKHFFTNLTEEANSAYLKTALGDVKVFLDLYDDNDALGIGNISQMGLLLNLDSNKDGLLNANDEYFSKLKVKGYDKDGNEIIKKLSDVVSFIDLEKFIKEERVDVLEGKDEHPINKHAKDSRIRADISNPYKLFNAEYRYKKVEDESLKSFFEANAGDDGWVDLKQEGLFSGDFSNFAYAKKGFSDIFELSEFNPIYDNIEGEKFNKPINNLSYTNHQKANFERFYKNYKIAKAEHEKIQNETIVDLESTKDINTNLVAYLNKRTPNTDKLIKAIQSTPSSLMVAMQNDFKNVTGLDFSEKNLEKVKRMFELNADETASRLKDADSVIAMKLNSNGSITLRFNSGRELTVTELYTDTGKLHSTKDGKRAKVELLDNENNIRLRKFNLDNTAIIDTSDKEERLISLKELGVETIKNSGVKGFILTLKSGEQISSNDLFNILFLEDETTKKVFEDKDKLYRKVDVMV